MCLIYLISTYTSLVPVYKAVEYQNSLKSQVKTTNLSSLSLFVVLVLQVQILCLEIIPVILSLHLELFKFGITGLVTHQIK